MRARDPDRILKRSRELGDELSLEDMIRVTGLLAELQDPRAKKAQIRLMGRFFSTLPLDMETADLIFTPVSDVAGQKAQGQLARYCR